MSDKSVRHVSAGGFFAPKGSNPPKAGAFNPRKTAAPGNTSSSNEIAITKEKTSKG